MSTHVLLVSTRLIYLTPKKFTRDKILSVLAKMVAFSARILIGAAIVVMNQRRKKQLYKKKQLRTFWRRGIFRERILYSEYFHLYQRLRDTDREFHYQYIRMSKERFDHLLSLIRADITKKDTPMRKAISAEERLVITLRYLSAGHSHRSLSFSFRVQRTIVSSIITEVCQAIYRVLQPVYMNTPSTEDEWRHIAEDFENIWDLPHTVGAIDGKHIRIECPRNSGSYSF